MRTVVLCLLSLAVFTLADLVADFADLADRLPKQVTSEILRLANAFGDTAEANELFNYLEHNNIDIRSAWPVYLRQAQVVDLGEIEEKNFGDIDSLISYIIQVVYSGEVYPIIREKIATSPDFANFAAAVRDPKFLVLLRGVVKSVMF